MIVSDRLLRVAALVTVLIAIGFRAPCQAAPTRPQTLYYNTNNGIDATDTLQYQVLKLVLAKCGKAYALQPSPLGKATEQRAIEALAAGEKVDVAWLGATAEADRRLLPVRIPIDRGMLGYRILLIDGARQAEFSRVRSLDDLKRLSALQGTGWPDVTILRDAGLTVRTGEYKNLFRMLVAGRADYFPRSAYEAFSEKADNAEAAPGLAVEKTLLLHYTLTSMFYVRKSNRTLHDDIQRGFTAAYADGSYEALFRRYPGIRTALTQGDFKSRRLIEIDNPLLPAETKALDQRYWFKP